MTPDCMIKLADALTPDEYNVLENLYESGNPEQWRVQLARYAQSKKTEVRNKMAATVAMSDKITSIMARMDADPVLVKLRKQQAGVVEGDQATKFKVDTKIRKRQATVLDQHLIDMISGGGARPGFKGVSLDVHVSVVRNQLGSFFSDLLEGTRPTIRSLGNLRGKDTMERFVQAIYKSSKVELDSVETAMVKSWKAYNTEKIRRFRAAGGTINPITDYTLGLSHNMTKIRKTGENEWVKRVLDKDQFQLLKPKEVIDMPDEEFARKMYRHMTSDGIEGFRQDQLGKLSKNERYIQPLNSESWLSYNRDFGKHDNPMRYLENDFEQWGRKIGMHEMFGDDAKGILEDLVRESRKITGDSGIGEDALLALDYVTNTSARDDFVSTVLQKARIWHTVTKLGMATITTTNDMVVSSARAMYNGLSPVRIFRRYLKNLASSKDLKVLRSKGFILESALSRGVATHRFLDGINSDWIGNLGHVAIKGSFMEAATNAGKTANVLEWAENFAKNRHIKYDKLPQSVRKALEHYGITPTEWGSIDKAVFKSNGVELFDPTYAGLDPRTASKFMGLIHSEMVQAVIEPNVKSLMYTQFKTAPGSFMNEVAKSRGQFWSFPVTFLMNNWMTIADKTLSGKSRLAYGVQMAGMTTVMGMLIVQAKELAKGRTMRDFDESLVLEGFLQGGASGPIGDLFFRDPNQYGGPLAAIAGVSAAPVVDAVKYFHKSVFKPEDTDFLADLSKTALKAVKDAAYLPNMWATRLAIEKAFGEEVDKMVNPNYYKDLVSYRKWLRERGQEQLFKPSL